MIIKIIIPITVCVVPLITSGQTIHQTDKYIQNTEKSLAKVERKVSAHTLKFEDKCIRIENEIRKKLNPGEAESLLNDMPDKFQKKLKTRLYSKIPLNGFLDTTQITLQYLKKIGSGNPSLDKAILNQEALQGKLEMLDEYHNWRVDRNLKFEVLLAKYPELKKYTQQLKQYTYYGKQQLADITATFEDKERLKQKILPELLKLQVFNDFFNKYKYFFNLGLNYNDTRSIAGLQSQAELSRLATDRVGADPASQSILRDRMNAARSEIDNYKSKLDNLNNASETPDFKINDLKTKRFLRRFEPGWNFQFQKSNYYFPSTADLAAQIAYKFHENGSIGVGMSYKAGMGENWSKIRFSQQGFGLRSFVDWKLKGTFYLHGGYERIRSTIDVSTNSYYKSWNGWNTAALMGINRIQKAGPKLKLNTMVLFNFLADQQPKSDKILIRFGHTL